MGARPARRVCAILLLYAQKSFSDAAATENQRAVEEAVLAMEAGEAALLDAREAQRTVDRYLLRVGSANARNPLLSALNRLDVSLDLKKLVEDRLAEMG